MKHFYLLFFVCIFALNAQDVAVEDPKFEAALIELGLDQGDLDGFISSTAVMYVRDLDISNKNITNLDGISAFINLESIDASGNTISSADFSGNLYVKEINLHSNALKSINVSNNVWLESLNVYNNQLTDIDLKNNRNLAYLAVAENFITDLDVTSNRLLETLYCQNNQIASVNVAEMQNLKILDFEYNNVSEVNVNNTGSLVQINGSNNFLSEIDLDNSPQLEYINLMFNSLEDLNLSNNTNLTTIMVANNSLYSLNIKNGNNNNLAVLRTENNSGLSCITVDDSIAEKSEADISARWNKDYSTGFSENCDAEIAEEDNSTDKAVTVFVDENKNLNIDSEASGVASLYNMTGIAVVTSEIEEGNQSINLSSLNNSVYVLNIVSNAGSYTKKIMLR